MCGIAGVINFNGETPSYTLLEEMGNSIAHRGPDDKGTYAAPNVGLAHRRLTIIDLSDGGHQPMFSDDESIVIVFNGEIYNYLEIAQELRVAGRNFKSSSDTEVIIQAYQQWGVECLSRFNGMFSFALWDTRRNRLFAARDRLGIKPFFYWFDGAKLIFASEIKAMLKHPGVSVEPNSDAIHQYLLYSRPNDDSTWYKGVKQLMPGHYLLADKSNRLNIKKYWDLNFEIDFSRSYECFTTELQDLLADSFKLQMRSDMPIGAHLSGGVDSSSIVSYMAKNLDGLHTFSAAYPEIKEADESHYINIVSKQFGTHHHLVTPQSSDLEALLPKLLWHLDEPQIGASILPMFRVSEMVKEAGISVVLGGQGADECFSGYPPYFTLAVKNMLSGRHRPPISEYLRAPSYLFKGGSFGRVTDRFSRKPSIPWIKGLDDIGAQFRQDQIENGKSMADLMPMERQNSQAIKHYLRGLLHNEDRISMACSIESRVPLLDHRIVELSTKIPYWMKVGGGQSKRILRHAVTGITPQAILDRKDKKGYPVPIASWFSSSQKKYVESILLTGKQYSGDLICSQGVKELISRHGEQDNSAAIWAILCTELWFRGLVNNWSDV